MLAHWTGHADAVQQQRDDQAVFTTRVGDLQRQECLALLAEHHLQGRVRDDGDDQRAGQALQALTEADLVRLVTDLPVGVGLAACSSRRAALLDVPRSSWTRIAVPLTGISAAAYITSVMMAGAEPSTDDALAASLITGVVGFVVGRRRRHRQRARAQHMCTPGAVPQEQGHRNVVQRRIFE